MADGPAGFPRGFPCPAVLGILPGSSSVLATGLLPSMADLSRSLAYPTLSFRKSHDPWEQAPRFRLLRIRSPLLTESLRSFPQGKSPCCFLFLRVLRCFSSPGLPPSAYGFSGLVHGFYTVWVSPFGHPRIDARLQLPEAFRRSPRPSSAPGA